MTEDQDRAERHAAEAERLLALVQAPIYRGYPTGFSERADGVALANLHATLALYYGTKDRA